MCPIVPTFTCGLVRSNFSLPIRACLFQSIKPINLVELAPGCLVHLLQTHQVELAHLRPVRHRQRFVERARRGPHLLQGTAGLLHRPTRQHGLVMPDEEPFSSDRLQEALDLRAEEALKDASQHPIDFSVIDRYRRLFKCRHRVRYNPENLERETGIEPATNSLEGCDSTTELLPPDSLATDLHGCSRIIFFSSDPSSDP